jgi:hypothetical protein
MKRFLRLKHWQVFFVSWGLLTAFFACLFTQPDIIVYYLPLWILIFLIGTTNSFIWVWVAVAEVIQTIALGMRPKDNLFRICFWIPVTYVSYLVGFLLFNLFVHKTESFNIELELKLLGGFGLLSVMCILYGLMFAAKVIKSAELQRNLKFHEYLPEFVLLILAPIGLWVIQPRLNKLTNI